MNPTLGDMLWGTPGHLIRTLIVGVLAYVSLVLVVRISGKRTLSKLSAFDLVVTVALGSCLATMLLSKDTSWLQGLTAFALLIGMQYLVAWSASRSQRINRFVKSSPSLLFYKGQLQQECLDRERVTSDDVYAAMRQQGASSIESVTAVVLESDGSLSVLLGSAESLSVLRPERAFRSERELLHGSEQTSARTS